MRISLDFRAISFFLAAEVQITQLLT